MQGRLFWLAVALAVTAVAAREVSELGEAETAKGVPEVATAVEMVAGSGASDQLKWQTEAATGTWQCKHCHSECATDTCRGMCSQDYCGGGAFKVGRTAFLKVDGPVTPAYAEAIKSANKAMEAITTATTESQMEAAKLALSRAQSAAHSEMTSYKSRAKIADTVDKAAYGSRQAREAEDDKTYIMEKATVENEAALAKSDESSAARAAAKNKGFVKAADTVAETASFSDGTSMMSAVQEENAAEKDALKSMSSKVPTPAASLASAADMAAKIESLNVKVKAAADEAATASASSEEELGSDDNNDDDDDEEEY